MLYRISKIFIRLSLKIFCKRIVVRNKELLNEKGPLLLTANHPNALVDAIIIGTLFKEPVHFLTRGDVFNKTWKRKLLFLLNMVPVFRMRDGVKNLHLNQYAFDKSKDILRNNGIVLIFIEGACKHTHELQPFKKGAARIAFNCWKENIPVKVMPVSIRYDSLYNFGKNVLVNIKPSIEENQLNIINDEAKKKIYFNQIINHQLTDLLEEQPGKTNPSSIFSAIPALIGKLLHAPFYYPIKVFVFKKTEKNEFYDSVLLGLLFFCYPFYVLIMAIIGVCLFKSIYAAPAIFFIFPFTAWCAVQYKK